MSQIAGAHRSAEPEQLAWFHGLPAADAREQLLACCAAEPWAGRLVADRPYPTVAALLRESDEAVTSLTVPQLADALAGHPRIGERVPAPAGSPPTAGHRPAPGSQPPAGPQRAAGPQPAAGSRLPAGSRPPMGHRPVVGHQSAAGSRSAGWSRQEQSAMAAADEPTRRAMAELNAAYEERFGHIYLVCATGRSAPELLALLQARLGHDDAAEWRTVRSELQQINRIRLRKLLAGAA